MSSFFPTKTGCKPTRIKTATALLYDETEVYQRYVGNKWGEKEVNIYLGKPIKDALYPLCGDKKDALKFKFVRPTTVTGVISSMFGGSGSSVFVKAGEPFKIVVAEGPWADYSLAVPTLPLYSTVYLYKGIQRFSRWVVWLANDRTDVPLHLDDEVIIFSEAYLPEKLMTTKKDDPYMRLTVADPDTKKARYVKWRAGEWDVWTIEKA